ncbi:hypothetical protein GCM10009609_33410 [Pseudonocardia aurantiaca]|uniref:Nuclear transport factor 2 family protein n=1 Tax=Pseudonocardia aurantiaca TaxID=75290 RepID=A0ABW4FRJ2_9PSEU
MDSSGTQILRSTEGWLDALEAVQAITRMEYRYWRACDNKDPDGFRRCFVRSGAGDKKLLTGR